VRKAFLSELSQIEAGVGLETEAAFDRLH